MMTIRRSEDRGAADHGWLKSKHTFSFASFYDPGFMGFGPLRVINEDRVQGGAGFPTHGHQDMEIISYVLDGALEHKDSIGGGSVIRPGEIQRMTAGTGVRHSEFNHSNASEVHFLQIWIEPAERGLAPSYEQQAFSVDDRRGKFRLIGSPQGGDGIVTIHQDVRLYSGLINGPERASMSVAEGRIAWAHVAQGSVSVNGERLNAGDAVAIENESVVDFSDGDGAEVLFFDMAQASAA